MKKNIIFSILCLVLLAVACQKSANFEAIAPLSKLGSISDNKAEQLVEPHGEALALGGGERGSAQKQRDCDPFSGTCAIGDAFIIAPNSPEEIREYMENHPNKPLVRFRMLSESEIELVYVSQSLEPIEFDGHFISDDFELSPDITRQLTESNTPIKVHAGDYPMTMEGGFARVILRCSN